MQAKPAEGLGCSLVLTYAIEAFLGAAFVAEDDLKILVEEMPTNGAHRSGSVHFKRTRVPFLSPSRSFGGKAGPDSGGDQTASHAVQAFPL